METPQRSVLGRHGPTPPALRRKTRGAEGAPRGPTLLSHVLGCLLPPSCTDTLGPAPGPLTCPVNTSPKGPAGSPDLCLHAGDYALPAQGNAIALGTRHHPLRPGPPLPPWSPQSAAPWQAGDACQHPSQVPSSLVHSTPAPSGWEPTSSPRPTRPCTPRPSPSPPRSLFSGHTATRGSSLVLPPQGLCTEDCPPVVPMAHAHLLQDSRGQLGHRQRHILPHCPAASFASELASHAFDLLSASPTSLGFSVAGIRPATSLPLPSPCWMSDIHECRGPSLIPCPMHTHPSDVTGTGQRLRGPWGREATGSGQERGQRQKGLAATATSTASLPQSGAQGPCRHDTCIQLGKEVSSTLGAGGSGRGAGHMPPSPARQGGP